MDKIKKFDFIESRVENANILKDILISKLDEIVSEAEKLGLYISDCEFSIFDKEFEDNSNDYNYDSLNFNIYCESENVILKTCLDSTTKFYSTKYKSEKKQKVKKNEYI